MRNTLIVAVSVIRGLDTRLAMACPYCDSEVGRRVSAGIFNSDFWANTFLTLLPIPVMVLIVALIHYGLPWPTRRDPPRQESG